MSNVHAAGQTDELETEMDWRVIDGELRKIAAQRGQLDANEAFWLRRASHQEIWRNAGRASFLEYLEEALGYAPKCARERLRVAVALDAVPELAEALATGEQSYSAIRELSRIATPETQTAWREAARGKNVRQIEELVAVHAPGDRPSDPPRADLKPKVVRFEVSPATFARLRQVQQLLAEEHGTQLDDDALIETLCAAILDGGSGETDQGRARYQIMTTICSACSQAWQLGGGREIAVTATNREIAECDAQRIGSDQEPGRAVQDIPPRVRRHVWRRDHGNCQVPGCRSARNIDIHHVVPRHLGGDHEATNLTLLCSGHHRSHHAGALLISGRAPDLAFTWKVSPHVGHALSPAPHDGHAAARHGASIDDQRVARSSTSQPVPDVRHELSPAPHDGHAASRHGASSEEQGAVRSSIARSVPHVGRAMPKSSSVPPGTPLGARSSSYERVVIKTEAIQALTTSGFHRSTARSLVDAALEVAPPKITLESLLVQALQLSRTR